MSNDMLRKHGEWLTGTNGGRGKITGKAEEYLLGSHGRYIKKVQVYTCMWIDEHKGKNTRGGYRQIGASALVLGKLVRQRFWLPVTSV